MPARQMGLQSCAYIFEMRINVFLIYIPCDLCIYPSEKTAFREQSPGKEILYFCQEL